MHLSYFISLITCYLQDFNNLLCVNPIETIIWQIAKINIIFTLKKRDKYHFNIMRYIASILIKINILTNKSKIRQRGRQVVDANIFICCKFQKTSMWKRRTHFGYFFNPFQQIVINNILHCNRYQNKTNKIIVKT